MQSEVAIKRDQLFLPKSQNKTFDGQNTMVDKFAKQIEKKNPGATAIMGDAADYAELAFRHLDATEGKDRLFGEQDKYHYTRTKTPTGWSSLALVGYFRSGDGLFVALWPRPGHRRDNVGVAPLVVPTGNK